MAVVTSSNPGSIASSFSTIVIDNSGLVHPDTPMPVTSVDMNHFEKIVITDTWGQIELNDLLDGLYTRFNPNKDESTKVLEVGSSAAYDFYFPNQEQLNKTLPLELKKKADNIDLHPSFDHDFRFKTDKHSVGRAEEFFIDVLTKKAKNFDQSKFNWREKLYLLNENLYLLSIKDQNGNQYDFLFYDTIKREFFSSRDACHLDVTPYVANRQQAQLIVHHYHPLQPYIDRINRVFRVPDPENVDHNGFLIYLYLITTKMYECVDKNIDGILKETLAKSTHSLNDLIKKFLHNHPINNAFQFIFSVNSLLNREIQSPIKPYTTSQLRICAQIRSPVERRLKHEDNDLLLNSPSIEDAKSFDWKCKLLDGYNILESILTFESNESLNPAAKAMFDSYVATLNEEGKAQAYKKRISTFVGTSRLPAILLQTITVFKAGLPCDLLNVVASHANETHYESLIGSMSPEWIVSNPGKAEEVFEWIVREKKSDKLYPFLIALIPYCRQESIQSFVSRAWMLNPNADTLRTLKPGLDRRSVTLPSIFGPFETTVAPSMRTSAEFIEILGMPSTETGMLALFMLYAKEGNAMAVTFAIKHGIVSKVYDELVPLINKMDAESLPSNIVIEIACNCSSRCYDSLTDNYPRSWIANNQNVAVKVLTWLIKENRTTKIYPFLSNIITDCHFLKSDEIKSLIWDAWRAHSDLSQLLSLRDCLKIDSTTLPELLTSRELEMLPHLRSQSSNIIKEVIGEPVNMEAKILLFTQYFQEDPTKAIAYAKQSGIAQNVVDEFLNTLGTGNEANRKIFNSYLASLSNSERVKYWSSWLSKTANPSQSPLFAMILDELKNNYDNALFLEFVAIGLPQHVESISRFSNSGESWIAQNPGVAQRVLEILNKEDDKDRSYLPLLYRIIAEGPADRVPQYIKRLWEMRPEFSALRAVRAHLVRRNLSLSCLMPSMEKEIAKPTAKALHELKKAFDDEQFTCIVEIGHPNHFDNTLQMILNNPEWIRNHSEHALKLLNRMIGSKKGQTLLPFIHALVTHGDSNNIQEIVKIVWPLLPNARTFLDLNPLLQARGISLSVVCRPIEVDVLRSLDSNHKSSAALAREFFPEIESPAGKALYLSLLLVENRQAAIDYAVVHGIEVSLIESIGTPIPVAIIHDKKNLSKDEINRLWTVAMRTYDVDLILELITKPHSLFSKLLQSMASLQEKEFNSRIAQLYPHILKESTAVALPYVLRQTALTEQTRTEIPRLLHEASFDEKLELLQWLTNRKCDSRAFIQNDLEVYKEKFKSRLTDKPQFDAFYALVGKAPFEALWKELDYDEQIRLARSSPFIFNHESLNSLLVPLSDTIFSSFDIEALEKLDLQPTTKSHYFSVFRSAILFEKYYPVFLARAMVSVDSFNVTPQEYDLILDNLIRYKSKHILSATAYPPTLSINLVTRHQEFIDAAIPHLGSMQTQHQKNLYTFAKARSYVPIALIQHFFRSQDPAWFCEGLKLFMPLSRNATPEHQALAKEALRNFVTHERSLVDDQTAAQFAVFITCIANDRTLLTPYEVFDSLKNSSVSCFRQSCFNAISALLEENRIDPKKRVREQETAIGNFIVHGLNNSPKDTTEFLQTNGFSRFPAEISDIYLIPFLKFTFKIARTTGGINDKRAIANFLPTITSYAEKRPDGIRELIDDYTAIITDLMVEGVEAPFIRHCIFAFYLLIVDPEKVKNLTNTMTAITIPEIQDVLKKDKFRAQLAVDYIVSLLKSILSKKYNSLAHTTLALEASNVFLTAIISAVNKYSREILTLIPRRIYYIPPTPEFHYSEFVICNQGHVKKIETLLTGPQKAEYYMATNLKNADASIKTLTDRMEGFSKYAIAFLDHGNTRAAQHVQTNLAEFVPNLKKLKGMIDLQPIFSRLIPLAAKDPEVPTAQGTPFLLKTKDLLIDFLRVVIDIKGKERDKLVIDFINLTFDMVKAFYEVSKTRPDYLGNCSELLTMIECEKYISDRYDIYFEMCAHIMPQFVKVLDEVSRDALDPMTVLILCQLNIAERHKAKQKQTMKDWFALLTKEGRGEYVAHIQKEYPAVEEVMNFK